MKVVIELDDALLRSAVQAQVGAALAAMTRESIEVQAKAVISKALQRIDWTGTAEREARKLLVDHVQSAMENALGSRYSQREAVRALIQEAALKAIKEAK